MRFDSRIFALLVVTAALSFAAPPNAKDVEDQLQSQLTLLEKAPADSSCLQAVLIALKDKKVRDLFIQKATNECYGLKDVCCLQIPRIPEYEYVLFDFDCIPPCFCIVDPQFLVVVDYVNGKVIDIKDPYFGPTKPCRSVRDAGSSLTDAGEREVWRNKRESVEITVGSRNYEFEIDGKINPPITVAKGSTVRVTLTSERGTHDWTVAEVVGETEKVLARTCAVSSRSPEPVTIEFTACTTGEHVYYCSLGSHRRRGMEGRFIVVEE